MNDVKRMRILNFAIGILKQYGTNAQIDFVNHELIDLSIVTAGDKSCGLYVVMSADEINPDVIRSLLSDVQQESVISFLEGRPLYLLLLNEADFKLSISPLAIDNGYMINYYDSIPLKELNKESFGRHIEELRRLNHRIEVIDANNIYVVKNITLSMDSYGRKGDAHLIYLRKMSDEYKMSPKKDDTYLDKFNRCLSGHFQDEYPNDALDEAIYNAVCTKHPYAKKANNSLMFTTSEVRSLLRYRNYSHDVAEFRFLPDPSTVPTELYPFLGQLEGLKFKIDLFMLIRNPSNLFANEGFELRYDLSTWANTLKLFCDKLTTLKMVSTLFDEVK